MQICHSLRCKLCQRPLTNIDFFQDMPICHSLWQRSPTCRRPEVMPQRNTLKYSSTFLRFNGIDTRCSQHVLPSHYPGGIPNKKDGGGGRSSYLSGVKKAVLVSSRVFSLKRPTAGAFATPSTVLKRKII